MFKIGKLYSLRLLPWLFLVFYVLINILYLTRFPFVHSDESWLSGLSRNIMETGDFGVTETFFDLKPRHPHAIKILFHTLQILFIRLLGYEIFTVRLFSFSFGLLTLFWFYKLCQGIFASKKLACAGAVLLALDVQYIYASHFARQEIVLLFVLIFALHYFLSRIERLNTVHHLVLGAIIGFSIGLHPNSFIISLPFGLIYLFHILRTKKIKPAGLLLYVATVASFAAGFVALSMYFDPAFIRHYSSYGNEFAVFSPISSKVAGLSYFYEKLYYRVSGTYYTPDIRFQLLLFIAVLFLTLYHLYRRKSPVLKEKITAIVLAVLAVNAGIVIIGRYNQTSIVFIFPLFYILVVYVLQNLPKPWLGGTMALLCLVLAVSTACNALPFLSHGYDAYLGEIAKAVPKSNTVLANLNAEFYFDNGRLHDYRNLAYLREKGLSFEEYIRENKITYIIYPEEMDLIYQERPRWNGLYGNLFPYYQDMQEFLRTKCELVYEFSDPTYGIRIASHINKQDWNVKIYRVR